MVSTAKVTEHEHEDGTLLAGIREHLGVEFNDKNTFRFKAESHEIPLSGILCEQGNNISFMY